MIDHTQLVHGYQRAILSAFALCGRETFWSEGIKGRVLIVGLGGGALPMYIHKCLPQVRNSWLISYLTFNMLLLHPSYL